MAVNSNHPIFRKAPHTQDQGVRKYAGPAVTGPRVFISAEFRVTVARPSSEDPSKTTPTKTSTALTKESVRLPLPQENAASIADFKSAYRSVRI